MMDGQSSSNTDGVAKDGGGGGGGAGFRVRGKDWVLHQGL